MKNIIVDTNILFSALIGKNKKLRDTILSPKEITLFSPKFAVVELFKYKDKIEKYSSLNEDEILELLHNLLKKINLFDEESLTDESLKKAFELCADIDEKDILFVAITIEVNGLLWTKDKKLITGLESKGFNSFFELE